MISLAKKDNQNCQFTLILSAWFQPRPGIAHERYTYINWDSTENKKTTKSSSKKTKRTSRESAYTAALRTFNLTSFTIIISIPIQTTTLPTIEQSYNRSKTCKPWMSVSKTLVVSSWTTLLVLQHKELLSFDQDKRSQFWILARYPS